LYLEMIFTDGTTVVNNVHTLFFEQKQFVLISSNTDFFGILTLRYISSIFSVE
jgi:hypothetical protein